MWWRRGLPNRTAKQSEMNITKLDLREPLFVHTKMFDQ